MKILVIGSGGREHALVWKLRQSPRVTEIFCAPGNAGIAELATLLPLGIHEHEALAKFATEQGIGLTVVGPDDALAAGIVDYFQARGLRIFGPTQHAAQFESSKIFAKEFMQRHGIPTAQSGHFTDSAEARAFCTGKSYPLVIKADGLALGKGVIIAQSEAEALETIGRIMDDREFGEAGRGVVIEEFLTGQECSLHALVDGKDFLLFPPAQDHKQIFDGDRGPNTGGMGTFSPAKLLTPALREQVIHELMEPFMVGLAQEGIPFNGLLFPGLMVTADGPKVLEFNCRFGDPETQVLLTRLKSDLLDLLEASVDGRLGQCQVEWDDRAAVCVVMASAGYPGSYEKGVEITGLEQFADSPDVVVFHAGTRRVDGKLVTNGGRVLGVTALGADLRAARDLAYTAVKKIHFAGAQYRTDIAVKGLAD